MHLARIAVNNAEQVAKMDLWYLIHSLRRMVQRTCLTMPRHQPVTDYLRQRHALAAARSKDITCMVAQMQLFAELLRRQPNLERIKARTRGWTAQVRVRSEPLLCRLSAATCTVR